MTKFAVSGGSTLNRFRRLVAGGKMVLDKRSNTYFPESLTVIDRLSGRPIAKQFNGFIHDQNKEISKYRKGKGWIRGGAQFD